jgi:hypothetical protein
LKTSLFPLLDLTQVALYLIQHSEELKLRSHAREDRETVNEFGSHSAPPASGWREEGKRGLARLFGAS